MTEKKNRTIHYSFKATPEENAIIQRKMKTFGIKNQSAFIRAMALNGYAHVTATMQKESANRIEKFIAGL